LKRLRQSFLQRFIAAAHAHGTNERDDVALLRDDGTDDNLVFVNEAGKAVSASNLVEREFRPIVETAGISDEFRFHDLRHSHATLLLSGGMNPKVVQERLGHQSVKTTLDLYGHVLPTAQRDAATLVGNVLFSGKSLTSSLTAVRQRRSGSSAEKKKALTA
jgi:site-specific recombinase XerD